MTPDDQLVLFQFIIGLARRLVVEVDFGQDLSKAIEAGGFDTWHINPDFTPANLPPDDLTGCHSVEVRLDRRDFLFLKQELLDQKRRLIHPLALIAIGKRFPHLQRKTMLITWWLDSAGNPWILCLDGINGERHAEISNGCHNDAFGARALALRSMPVKAN